MELKNIREESNIESAFFTEENIFCEVKLNKKFFNS